MDEHRHPSPGSPANAPATGDRDVDLKAVLVFMGWLTGVSAAVMALVWVYSVRLRDDLAASDPPPSPIAAANAPRAPPEPRLDEAPPKALAEHRAREDAALSAWGWIDRERGLASIPVERAMEIIAEKGLPPPPPAPAPAPPEGGKK
jgi:hypothetical protein